MKTIDIFSDAAVWENARAGANASISYVDAKVRVSIQEVTGVIDGNGRRVRVFEVQEAIRIDDDGDEIGMIEFDKIELSGLTRLPVAGQWALISNDDLLSVSESAALANVGRQFIHDEIGRGNLPALKVGRQYTIKGVDFAGWMRNPARGSRRKISVVLNETGEALFGDYYGSAVALTELIETFSGDNLSINDFRVDGHSVQYRTETFGGLGVGMPIETEQGKDDQPIYWYSIGTLA